MDIIHPSSRMKVACVVDIAARTDSAAASKLFAKQMTQMARMDAVRTQVNHTGNKTRVLRNFLSCAMELAGFQRIRCFDSAFRA